MTPPHFPARRARLQAAAVVLVGALGLAACGGGGSDGSTSSGSGAVKLTVAPGPVTVEAAGIPAGTLSDQDRDAIVAVVRRYITAGTLDPLAGKPVGNLAPLFSSAATAGLTGADRAALVDEGLPPATGTVTATAAPVALTALSDPAGTIDLVGATLTLDVAAKTARGPVTVKRDGELVLRRAPEGWKIDSYRVTVNRDGAGLGVASTTTTEGT
jgi:hypothetical protein